MVAFPGEHQCLFQTDTGNSNVNGTSNTITVSAAVPAAADTGLALNVPGCAIFSRPVRAVTLKSDRKSVV